MLDVNVIPLELHDDSGFGSESVSRLRLLPAPAAQSFNSRRLLTSNARRAETATVRKCWKELQAAKVTSSRLRPHLPSAPTTQCTSSKSMMSSLRKTRASHSTRESSKDKRQPVILQFPHLENEVVKGNLTERLPYFVPIHVDIPPPNDYPTKRNVFPEVFFLFTMRHPKGGKSPYLSTPRKERYFVNPEWASEIVSQKRFFHKSNPEAFRYCWM